jgi:hypothetical protein
MSGVWPYMAALIPSAGVGFLFWIVIKNMIEGDRKERLAHSQWDAQQPVEKDGEKTVEKDDGSHSVNGEKIS